MTEPELSLGVTATRKNVTPQQIRLMWNHIQLCSEFHLGACVGGDEMGFDIAVKIDRIAIWVHPPVNEKLMMPRGKWTLRDNIFVLPAKDYHARNRDIVDASQRVIALPDGPRRPHSGTWYTIDYCIEQKKRVTICFPDGRIDDRIPDGYDWVEAL